MKYSANYDKYPFVQVSYNSDDCISGWFAITDSISERLKVLEKPLKVVAIECYQGVFENDIRNAFAGRFNNALFVHTDSAMLPEEKINAAINQAVKEAEEQGVVGKASTPFLLARVAELTGGDSLKSNIQLVFNNAVLACEIAKEYQQIA